MQTKGNPFPGSYIFRFIFCKFLFQSDLSNPPLVFHLVGQGMQKQRWMAWDGMLRAAEEPLGQWLASGEEKLRWFRDAFNHVTKSFSTKSPRAHSCSNAVSFPAKLLSWIETLKMRKVM